MKAFWLPTFLRRLTFVAIGMAGAVAFAHDPHPEKEQPWLSRYRVDDRNAVPIILPRAISEASGLAITADGRLFTHDDERGIIYQIDRSDGHIIKRFLLGRPTLRGDFEGIAIRKQKFYLVASNGTIYETEEGADNASVPYRSFNTFLSSANDVEGLEYDPAGDCLLVLCKGYPGKGYKGYRTAYAFDFPKMKLLHIPRLQIPLNKVSKKAHKGNFAPSGIALHPLSGTFFVLSAAGECIVELSRSGKVLAQEHLPAHVNPHPEGIAFGSDGTMYICNDGQDGRGSMTVYKLRKNE
jgi:sugar lactone lactonase YvrE